MAKDENRCWPGYEPVKGKRKNEQGSCRKKAASKSTDSEKKFQAKRQEQLDEWKKEHPKSPRKSAQHLAKPAAAKKRAPAKRKRAPSAAKKAAAKRTRRTASK